MAQLIRAAMGWQADTERGTSPRHSYFSFDTGGRSAPELLASFAELLALQGPVQDRRATEAIGPYVEVGAG